MALLPSSVLFSRESNIEGFILQARPRSGVRLSRAKVSPSVGSGRQGAVQEVLDQVTCLS